MPHDALKGKIIILDYYWVFGFKRDNKGFSIISVTCDRQTDVTADRQTNAFGLV